MNSIIKDYYPVFKLYLELREQLMAILNDDNVSFRIEGDNPTLGELCREIGEVEYAYIQSFKTFEQDFSYRNEEPGLGSSVEKLSTWFKELDDELDRTIQALSEEDIQTRTINRGGDFILPIQIQLEIYKEALLIFYGKVSVYLKALRLERPGRWQEWIG